MKEFLKHIVGIAIITVIIINCFSFLGLTALKRSSFYKPSFLVNQVKESDFDYVILGASTGLTTLNSEAIDSVIGTKGINMSMDDTDLASQYLMLRHFIEQGKKAKFCILAPNPTNYDQESRKLSDNDYRFLPFISDTYVNDHFKAYSSKEANIIKTSQWMPAIGMSYYNAELFYPAIVAAVQPDKRNRFDARGNYTYPIRDNDSADISERSPIQIEFKNDYVDKIQNLCEQNGMQLICYLSPMRSKMMITSSNNFKIINHSNILHNTMYFYDDLHVNSKGRQIASVQFARDINSILNRRTN